MKNRPYNGKTIHEIPTEAYLQSKKEALHKFQTNENSLKIVQTSCRYNGSNVTILVDMSILLYGDKFTDRYIKFFADGIF